MDPLVFSSIVTAAVSLLVAALTIRQNRQGARATNALSERVVDREDFKEVMDRMDQELNRAFGRISDLETRLEKEVEARQQADQRAREAERRASQAEAKVSRLERRVSQLEELLRDNNIPVPPVPG